MVLLCDCGLFPMCGCVVVCHVWYTHWALSHRFPRSVRNLVFPNKQPHVKREYKRAIGKCRGDTDEAFSAVHTRRQAAAVLREAGNELL